RLVSRGPGDRDSGCCATILWLGPSLPQQPIVGLPRTGAAILWCAPAPARQGFAALTAQRHPESPRGRTKRTQSLWQRPGLSPIRQFHLPGANVLRLVPADRAFSYTAPSQKRCRDSRDECCAECPTG